VEQALSLAVFRAEHLKAFFAEHYKATHKATHKKTIGSQDGSSLPPSLCAPTGRGRGQMKRPRTGISGGEGGRETRYGNSKEENKNVEKARSSRLLEMETLRKRVVEEAPASG